MEGVCGEMLFLKDYNPEPIFSTVVVSRFPGHGPLLDIIIEYRSLGDVCGRTPSVKRLGIHFYVYRVFG